MTTALTEVQGQALDPATIESVLLGGDLSRLTPQQRVTYYNRVCESLGLNPLTVPCVYMKNRAGATFLYFRKEAAEVIRKNFGVSITNMSREEVEGVLIVTAGGALPNGRTDYATGAIAVGTLKGQDRADAIMKAESKAKRRLTLSICGLGLSDESDAGEPMESAGDLSTPVIQRRSEKSLPSPTTPPPVVEASPVLESPVEPPAAGAPTSAIPPPAAPSQRPAGGSAPKRERDTVLITETAFIDPGRDDGGGAYWRIAAVITTEDRAPIGLAFVTQVEAVAKQAERVVGTGELMRAEWSRRLKFNDLHSLTPVPVGA